MDADEMPNGIGEYGLAATNPIPCKTAIGSTAYLGRLRAADGTKVSYERVGSTQSDVSPQPIDVYAIRHTTGQKLATIYISPYQKRISGKPPRGFMLAENSFAQISPERVRDENIRNLFSSVFPVISTNKLFMLYLHDLQFGPKGSGSDSLLLTLRLVSFDEETETGARHVKDCIEQDILLSDITLPSVPSVISKEYRHSALDMERTIQQRMDSMNVDELSPYDLLVGISLTSQVWDAVEF